jgi:hypothetical protein
VEENIDRKVGKERRKETRSYERMGRNIKRK